MGARALLCLTLYIAYSFASTDTLPDSDKGIVQQKPGSKPLGLTAKSDDGLALSVHGIDSQNDANDLFDYDGNAPRRNSFDLPPSLVRAVSTESRASDGGVGQLNSKPLLLSGNMEHSKMTENNGIAGHESYEQFFKTAASIDGDRSAFVGEGAFGAVFFTQEAAVKFSGFKEDADDESYEDQEDEESEDGDEEDSDERALSPKIPNYMASLAQPHFGIGHFDFLQEEVLPPARKKQRNEQMSEDSDESESSDGTGSRGYDKNKQTGSETSSSSGEVYGANYSKRPGDGQAELTFAGQYNDDEELSDQLSKSVSSTSSNERQDREGTFGRLSDSMSGSDESAHAGVFVRKDSSRPPALQRPQAYNTVINGTGDFYGDFKLCIETSGHVSSPAKLGQTPNSLLVSESVAIENELVHSLEDMHVHVVPSPQQVLVEKSFENLADCQNESNVHCFVSGSRYIPLYHASAIDVERHKYMISMENVPGANVDCVDQQTNYFRMPPAAAPVADDVKWRSVDRAVAAKRLKDPKAPSAAHTLPAATTAAEVEDRLRQLFHDVLLAFVRMHTPRDLAGRKMRVIHSDMKPGNIVAKIAGGRVQVYKVVDYGGAQLLGEAERTYQYVGTEDYMAPEVHYSTPLSHEAGQRVSVEGYDHTADVFALGMIGVGLWNSAVPPLAGVPLRKWLLHRLKRMVQLRFGRAPSECVPASVDDAAPTTRGRAYSHDLSATLQGPGDRPASHCGKQDMRSAQRGAPRNGSQPSPRAQPPLSGYLMMGFGEEPEMSLGDSDDAQLLAALVRTYSREDEPHGFDAAVGRSETLRDRPRSQSDAPPVQTQRLAAVPEGEQEARQTRRSGNEQDAAARRRSLGSLADEARARCEAQADPVRPSDELLELLVHMLLPHRLNTPTGRPVRLCPFCMLGRRPDAADLLRMPFIARHYADIEAEIAAERFNPEVDGTSAVWADMMTEAQARALAERLSQGTRSRSRSSPRHTASGEGERRDREAQRRSPSPWGAQPGDKFWRDSPPAAKGGPTRGALKLRCTAALDASRSVGRRIAKKLVPGESSDSSDSDSASASDDGTSDASR